MQQTRQPSRQFSLSSAVFVQPRTAGSSDSSHLSAGDRGQANSAGLLMRPILFWGEDSRGNDHHPQQIPRDNHPRKRQDNQVGSSHFRALSLSSQGLWAATTAGVFLLETGVRPTAQASWCDPSCFGVKKSGLRPNTSSSVLVKSTNSTCQTNLHTGRVSLLATSVHEHLSKCGNCTIVNLQHS